VRGKRKPKHGPQRRKEMDLRSKHQAKEITTFGARPAGWRLEKGEKPNERKILEWRKQATKSSSGKKES